MKRFERFKLLRSLASVVALSLAGGYAQALTLTSAYEDGSAVFGKATTIPMPFQCPISVGGENWSPPLTFGDVPPGTNSFMVQMVDTSATGVQGAGWTVYNIPATTNGLPINASPVNVQLPGVVDNGYTGPCPAAGSGVHTYAFTLYAYSGASYGAAPSPSAAIASATLTGTSYAGNNIPLKQAITHLLPTNAQSFVPYDSTNPSLAGKFNVSAIATAPAAGGYFVGFKSLTPSVCTVSTPVANVIPIDYQIDVHGNTVAPVSMLSTGPGPCTIVATQNGDFGLNPVVVKPANAVNLNVTINALAKQTVVLGSPVVNIPLVPNTPVNVTFSTNGAFNAVATSVDNAGVPTGLPVTFKVLPESAAICSVGSSTGTAPSQATVTMLTTGSCDLAADADAGTVGGVAYNAAAELVQPVGINNLTANVVKFGANPGPVKFVASDIGITPDGDGTFTVTTTGSAAGTVIFSVDHASTPPTVCSVPAPNLQVGNSVKVTMMTTAQAAAATNHGTGVCIIAANQGGVATRINPAIQVTQAVTINGKSKQAITFPQPTSPITYAPGYKFTVSASTNAVPAAHYPVAFKSTTPSVCTMTPNDGTDTSGVVTVLAGGTCTLIATQDGDPIFYNNAAVQTKSVTVNPAPQTITWVGGYPSVNLQQGSFNVAATTTAVPATRYPVTFNTTTNSVCTVTSTGLVTLVAVGTCTITADQKGDASYNPAPQQNMSVKVDTTSPLPQAQTITFANPGPQSLAAGTFIVSATASSGLPIAWITSPATICTNVGHTVTMVAVGSCTITASQGGGTAPSGVIYSAAAAVPQTITINAGQTTQTITFTNPGPQSFVANKTFTVTATATSNLPVTFSSATTDICTTPSDTTGVVTMLKVGTCIIVANQGGNSAYSPASPMVQSITITNPVMCGDANNDKTVTIADAIVIARSVANSAPLAVSDATDVNHSGASDISDALAIARFVATNAAVTGTCLAP